MAPIRKSLLLVTILPTLLPQFCSYTESELTYILIFVPSYVIATWVQTFGAINASPTPLMPQETGSVALPNQTLPFKTNDSVLRQFQSAALLADQSARIHLFTQPFALSDACPHLPLWQCSLLLQMPPMAVFPGKSTNAKS